MFCFSLQKKLECRTNSIENQRWLEKNGFLFQPFLTTVVPEKNGCGAAIVDVGHMMLVLLAMLCTFVTTVKWTNFVTYGVICARISATSLINNVFL